MTVDVAIVVYLFLNRVFMRSALIKVMMEVFSLSVFLLLGFAVAEEEERLPNKCEGTTLSCYYQ